MYKPANDDCGEFCCIAMKNRVLAFENRELDEEGLIRSVIWYDRPYRSYNVLLNRSVSNYSGWPITYCPWCGKKLPEELHPDDTIKKEFGEDYIKFPNEPGYKQLPPEVKKEFETDEWWKKRNIGPDDPGF